MYFVNSFLPARIPLLALGALVLLSLAFGGCGEMNNDLLPSGKDQRKTVEPDKPGWQVGQKAPSVTLSGSNGVTGTLSDFTAGGSDPSDAVVLYFTMWCPICMSHSDHLLYDIIPRFSERGVTSYFLVDFVSGSLSSAKEAEESNGYGGTKFTTIADSSQTLLNSSNAAMGTVIIVNRQGEVVMNEFYNDGSAVASTLEEILP